LLVSQELVDPTLVRISCQGIDAIRFKAGETESLHITTDVLDAALRCYQPVYPDVFGRFHLGGDESVVVVDVNVAKGGTQNQVLDLSVGKHLTVEGLRPRPVHFQEGAALGVIARDGVFRPEMVVSIVDCRRDKSVKFLFPDLPVGSGVGKPFNIDFGVDLRIELTFERRNPVLF